MIALVFFATVINYLDRQTLSVVAPVIVEEFHISNVDYSLIIFAFMLAYTIMNGISGPMIDRLGTKVGYAVCIGWWSIAYGLLTISGFQAYTGKDGLIDTAAILVMSIVHDNVLRAISSVIWSDILMRWNTHFTRATGSRQRSSAQPIIIPITWMQIRSLITTG